MPSLRDTRSLPVESLRPCFNPSVAWPASMTDRASSTHLRRTPLAHLPSDLASMRALDPCPTLLSRDSQLSTIPNRRRGPSCYPPPDMRICCLCAGGVCALSCLYIDPSSRWLGASDGRSCDPIPQSQTSSLSQACAGRSPSYYAPMHRRPRPPPCSFALRLPHARTHRPPISATLSPPHPPFMPLPAALLPYEFEQYTRHKTAIAADAKKVKTACKGRSAGGVRATGVLMVKKIDTGRDEQEGGAHIGVWILALCGEFGIWERAAFCWPGVALSEP
ncbi:hypothetical protein B0H13DRAFT_2349540 [Mycena leptocephala]|nr:hypothetical protein B0H13DRAFT_2349540 [Mycena leptocephala]